jgi:hypothetical protein
MEAKDVKPESLTFEEKRRYAEAYRVVKMALKYVCGYLFDYKIQVSSNLHKYEYKEPIELHLKVFWRKEAIEAEGPVA